MKIGIVGTGFSARAHVEAIRRIPGLEVVSVVSRSKERAEAFARKFGIPKALDGVQELIADQDVDAVHNCTPNDRHFVVNRAVLEGGKPLLSEKPLAMTSEETAELAALAERAGVAAGVCFNYRHYPLVRQMKESIRANEIGKVHLVHGGYLQDWLLYDTDYNWRLSREQGGASRAIADIGSHWCDTVQYVLGQKITEVFADLKTVHPVRYRPQEDASTFSSSKEMEQSEAVDIDTEDCGHVLVHFSNGATGVFTVSQVSAGRKNKLHFEIAGQHGTFAWDQERPNQLWMGKRDEANRVLMRDPALLRAEAAEMAHYPGGHEEGWPDGLKNLIANFYAAVRGESSQEVASFSDGHAIMKIIEAILQSHQTRQWVSIEGGK
ncbi:dehydrogenase [Marinithermofilum abyssi]|uniref:Dehydrogenase n=1 Tax=Marinithermofilum abyssi TaxID=1571185 RepID=A0A8J2YCV5_9BACL|nr:Gfo/Idh/MocA family oxidoreductase [Marinithermofilum abyssi]GGE12331.1 dehydrogenase [Marinithermofilum abyssi]